MKIVDVAEYYSENGGGIRTYIQAKMRIAEKHGHEVVVVAPGTRGWRGRKIWWAYCLGKRSAGSFL